jgi:ADP-ribose pyrophosphatase YjhB (NUDIX family)
MTPFKAEEGQHPWLEWIKQVHAISHWGLTYSQDPFDLERYEVLKALSVQMMADFTRMDKSRIETLFANEEGYITPKVDVRGVVFEGDKILLVQEKRDGLWTIPGGWADVGLSPGEVAAKEVGEEAGLAVRPVKMLAMLDRKFFKQPASAFHIYKVFMQCEITDTASQAEPQAGLETLDARFFAQDELPELSPYKVTTAQLDILFQHRQDPNRPTDFN